MYVIPHIIKTSSIVMYYLNKENVILYFYFVDVGDMAESRKTVNFFSPLTRLQDLESS